jgi:toxin ParE1/3/4
VDQGKVRTAGRFIDALEKAFDHLSQMPELGALGNFRNPGLSGIRVWPLSGFEKILIFYRPSDESLDVIRVLHSSRDIAGILEQGE